MASVTRIAVKPLQGGVGYQLTAADEWPPQAVAVTWDGTGAAGDFVVAVSYYSDGGVLIDRAWPEGVTNTTGDTGRTFFRPFKRGAGGSGGTDPNAVHYGVNAETGSFVDSRTDTGGYSWWDRTGTGVYTESGVGGTPGIVGTETNDGQVFDHAAIIVQRVSDHFEIQDVGAVTRFLVDHFGDMVLSMLAGSVADFTDHNGNSVVTILEDGNVFTKLPNADPGVTGRLWNNAGVVNVSP